MENPPPQTVALDPPIVPAADHFLSQPEFLLAVAVLVFGLTCLIFQFLLFYRRQSAEAELTKMTTVTLVVTGTLFVISAGFDNSQIAPAMGLFGTMIGYLLGRSEKSGSAS